MPRPFHHAHNFAYHHGAFAVPSGLGWTPSFQLRGSAHGFTPYLNPTSRRATTSATRWISTTGNDANTGLVQGSPKRSLWSALIAAGTTPTTFMIQAGTYDWDYSWAGQTQAADFNLIGYGGRVRISTQPTGLSWSSVGSGAYSTTFATAPYGVVDETNTDAYGVGTWLTAQASVADVKSLGGWYWTATTLTVKTFDGRAPDASLWAFPSSSSKWMMRINGASVTACVENIDFVGGYRAYITSVAQFTAIDTTFSYSEFTAFDGVACTEAQLWRCRAIGAKGTGGGADGFGYQAGWAKTLEVDCEALSNGWDGVDINNGSTTHGGKIIRCGGRYLNNQGPNIADVTSSKSLTLGATVGASRGISVAQKTNVGADGATGEVWLADCSLDGRGVQDLYTYNAGSKIYVRNTGYSGAGGTGTVTTW